MTLWTKLTLPCKSPASFSVNVGAGGNAWLKDDGIVASASSLPHGGRILEWKSENGDGEMRYQGCVSGF